VEMLGTLDSVLAGLLDVWDWESGLVLITSDHGNLEDLSVRSHTLNPVPTIAIGSQHAEMAAQVRDLADIAPAVRRFLRGRERTTSDPP
jgi:2,3-bisphosphoglycerate-independent phosphoglycerate mutase